MMYPLDKRGKTRIGYVKEKGIMPLEQAASIDFRVTEGWLSFKKKILELVAPCSNFLQLRSYPFAPPRGGTYCLNSYGGKQP